MTKHVLTRGDDRNLDADRPNYVCDLEISDAVELDARPRPEYTICTIVSNPVQYEAMLCSFKKGGFSDCEYIAVNNVKGNNLDAYEAMTLFLQNASAYHIVVCHQDVELLQDKRVDLDERIRQLYEIDPNWGVAGNAGGLSPGNLAFRITDPHGNDRSSVLFPARVQSLDENFLVIRRSANLSVSRNLGGFHFYGAELCFIARLLGYSSFVIDFHLQHKSAGNKDKEYHISRNKFVQKYVEEFRPRWLTTPCTSVYLTHRRWIASILNNTKLVELISRLGVKSPNLIGWCFRERS